MEEHINALLADDEVQSLQETSEGQQQSTEETGEQAQIPEQQSQTQEDSAQAQQQAQQQQAQAGEQEQEQGRPPAGFVPHGALHQERERRKEVEQSNQELTDKVSQMEGRFNQLVQQLSQSQQAQQAQQQAPAVPDPELEPEAALAYEQNMQAQQLQQLQQQMAMQQVDQLTRGYEQTFAQTTPDYQDAANHLDNLRSTIYRQQGIPDHQIPQLLAQERINFAYQSMQQGKNPAQALYEIAKAVGYTTQQQQPSEGQAVQQGVDQSGPPLAQQSAAQQGAEKMTTLQHGVKSGQSLGSNNNEMTLSEMAELSDDDFDVAAREFKQSLGWQ